MVYEKLPVSIEDWIDGIDHLNYKDTASPYWKEVISAIFNKRTKGQSIIIEGERGTGKTTWNVIGVVRDLYEIFLTEKASRPPKGLYVYFSSFLQDKRDFLSRLANHFNQIPFFKELRWFSVNNEITFPDMDFTIRVMSFEEYKDIENYSLYGISMHYMGLESDVNIKYIYEIYNTYLIPHLVATNPSFISWAVLGEGISNYIKEKDLSNYYTYLNPTRELIKKHKERGVEN